MAKQTNRIADNIDIQVEIMPVPFDELSSRPEGESSAAIRERVARAREIQEKRFADEPDIHCNAQMNSRLMQKYCVLSDVSRQLLKKAMMRNDMSARAYDRILKVARTIADLEGSADIMPSHVAEAAGYRSLDRASWGTTVQKLSY